MRAKVQQIYIKGTTNLYNKVNKTYKTLTTIDARWSCRSMGLMGHVGETPCAGGADRLYHLVGHHVIEMLLCPVDERGYRWHER